MPSSQQKTTSQSVKNRYFKLLKLIVSVLLILWILTLIDFKTLVIVFKELNLAFFMIAFFSVLLTHWVNCIRWKLCLLEASLKFSIVSLLVPYFKSMFVGIFLPTEYRGDIVKVQYLWNKIDNKLAIVSVFWARVTGVLSAFILLLFTSILFHKRYAFINMNVLITAIFLLILPILIIFILKFIQRSSVSLHSANKKESSKFNWWSKIDSFFKQLLALITHKQYAWKILTLALISQIIMVFNNYFYALSLNQNIDILDMFFFIPLLSVVSLIPITIGGIGLKEGAFVLFFTTIGITAENALAMALLNRSVFLLLSLGGGLLYLKSDEKDKNCSERK